MHGINKNKKVGQQHKTFHLALFVIIQNDDIDHINITWIYNGKYFQQYAHNLV